MYNEGPKKCSFLHQKEVTPQDKVNRSINRLILKHDKSIIDK